MGQRFSIIRGCGAVVSAVAGLLPARLLAQPPAPEPPACPHQRVANDRHPKVRENPFALLQDPYESIYLPPGPPRVEEGVNAGGVNFGLRVAYLTDYVYRGIDQSERLAAVDEDGNFNPGADVGAEDAPNNQFDGSLKLNLGRLPHPVAGVFANVFNDDPISRFQEIRPYFGFDWDLRPLRIQAGQVSYIFPERETLNTNEIWASVTFDDARLWRIERPLLAPYVYAAYDYDLYDGFYVEAGVRHQFELEDTGITVTAVADVAWVADHVQFADTTEEEPEDTGFQHYDVGLIGSLSLNHALGIPRRYGQWTFEGSLFYTDGISKGLLADTQVWGGAAIVFKY